MSSNLLALAMKMNIMIMRLEKTEMKQNKHTFIFIVHCCHINDRGESNSIELASY